MAIREGWKSLPSGTMQNLPAGQEVRLQDFATNMISISDNTAADHLLYFLGRDNVQSMLTPMGNAHAVLDMPFMATLEMFKLKWAIDPKKTLDYIRSDATTRLQDLQLLDSLLVNAAGKDALHGLRDRQGPRGIF